MVENQALYSCHARINCRQLVQPRHVGGEDLGVRLDEVDDVRVREQHAELAHLGGQRARHVHAQHQGCHSLPGVITLVTAVIH